MKKQKGVYLLEKLREELNDEKSKTGFYPIFYYVDPHDYELLTDFIHDAARKTGTVPWCGPRGGIMFDDTELLPEVRP